MSEFRPYQSSESSVITDLFVSVFTQSAGEGEGVLLGKLTEDMMANTKERDLYGYVAVRSEQIVGAIFFTRLFFKKDIEAFILSPVAIHTDYQRMGIGQGLINHGLAELKKQGVAVVTTYGDPAYYCKVGFHRLSQQVIKAPLELSQPEGWLGQSLSGGSVKAIPGPCSCVKALDDPTYW